MAPAAGQQSHGETIVAPSGQPAGQHSHGETEVAASGKGSGQQSHGQTEVASKVSAGAGGGNAGRVGPSGQGHGKGSSK
jgi:hypothetical protein